MLEKAIVLAVVDWTLSILSYALLVFLVYGFVFGVCELRCRRKADDE